MHFEFLVEDTSLKKFLAIIIPKIITNNNHTYKIHSYSGIGSIPKNLSKQTNIKNRMLLNNLPKLLSGYGKTFNGYPDDYKAVVMVIMDLDDECLKTMRIEFFSILKSCLIPPETCFIFAIEEMEAWLLGDINAIQKAYPKVKKSVLSNYNNDSICGTWELLADAIYEGGSRKLMDEGYPITGKIKTEWAENIAPHLSVANNKSPSFQYFLGKIVQLI
jgi:hypothetical protein